MFCVFACKRKKGEYKEQAKGRSMALAMVDLEKVNKLFQLTDGRDKIYKSLQNLTKIMAWALVSTDKVASKKFTTLSKSLGEGRSILRMAKWVANVNKIRAFMAKGDYTAQPIVETLRVIGDFGFIVGDNIAYLAKYKMLPVNAKLAAKQSKIFQFWGFFLATVLDIWNLIKLSKKVDDAEKIAKERRQLYLSFIKDLADTLNVLYAVGYMGKYYNPGDGFLGMCGATSGIVATYLNWGKLK